MAALKNRKKMKLETPMSSRCALSGNCFRMSDRRLAKTCCSVPGQFAADSGVIADTPRMRRPPSTDGERSWSPTSCAGVSPLY